MTNARARIFWTLFALVSISLGTAIAIRFAQGYRPSRETLVAGRGLLVANSTPTGARVMVNGRFASATNDTLYLDPGTYSVEIAKEGYLPWKKDLLIEKELVTQANALLFPAAPSLTPLTFVGALKPIPSPDGQRLAYYTASASADVNNGFYVLDLTDNPLALQRGPRQVARPSVDFPADTTRVVWSPNSSQLLLVSPRKSVLLDPTRLTDLSNQPDITFQLSGIFSQWEEEMYLRDRERLAKFPDFIQEIATSSAVNVYFSPDEKRLLYTARETFVVPDTLIPPKPSSSTQLQTRTTEVGKVYVYDREEDRQFLIGQDDHFTLELANKSLLATDLNSPRALSLEASPSAFVRLQAKQPEETVQNFLRYHTPLFTHGFQWFPNSSHIIKHNGGITIMEYDSTNAVRVYSGPFNQSFVYPWPNGSRLIVLTNFNQDAQVPENLYTIELR